MYRERVEKTYEKGAYELQRAFSNIPSDIRQRDDVKKSWVARKLQQRCSEGFSARRLTSTIGLVSLR